MAFSPEKRTRTEILELLFTEDLRNREFHDANVVQQEDRTLQQTVNDVESEVFEKLNENVTEKGAIKRRSKKEEKRMEIESLSTSASSSMSSLESTFQFENLPLHEGDGDSFKEKIDNSYINIKRNTPKLDSARLASTDLGNLHTKVAGKDKILYKNQEALQSTIHANQGTLSVHDVIESVVHKSELSPDKRSRNLDQKGVEFQDENIGDVLFPEEFHHIKRNQNSNLGPVPISHLWGTLPSGLLDQPSAPKFKLGLVQVYLRGERYGGDDKSPDGHRYDSVAIANGMIGSNMSCQLLHYVHEEHEEFFKMCEAFDGLVLRVNPGQIAADGGSQREFDDGIANLERKHRVQLLSSPSTVAKLGVQRVSYSLANTDFGMQCTSEYNNGEELSKGLRSSLSLGPRVLKHNRSACGKGVWKIELIERPYDGKAVALEDNVLLTRAIDNHKERHTLQEVLEFFTYGKTPKAGSWSTKSPGKYFKTGSLIDQRYCERILEGELRCTFIGPEVVSVIHKIPAKGSFSAVGGTGCSASFHSPKDSKYKHVLSKLTASLPILMQKLGIDMKKLPLWWTCDLVNAAKVHEPDRWIILDSNCSCVGVQKLLPACHQGYSALSEQEKLEGQKLCDQMGKRALFVLTLSSSKL